MRTYTVYDNIDGGFTVKYRYYDYSAKEFKVRIWNCPNQAAMKSFTDRLRADGYKYVGKI